MKSFLSCAVVVVASLYTPVGIAAVAYGQQFRVERNTLDFLCHGGGTSCTANDTRVTWRIYASGPGDFTVMELLLDAPGQIWQADFGGNAPVIPPIGLPPHGDTWVALDGFDLVDLGVGFAGGALDIGGSTQLTFSEDLLDVTWFAPGSSAISLSTERLVAQITLDGPADGTIYMISNGDEYSQMIRLPEPDCSMLAIGLVALYLRSKARRTVDSGTP